ncbi:hypothetical protein GUI12_02225 [Anaplasmataceae bacterium AB001_6]|nr:hypothetical protein GUI12_02225 [Anaplasmataceae bacterium AB001_6]
MYDNLIRSYGRTKGRGSFKMCLDIDDDVFNLKSLCDLHSYKSFHFEIGSGYGENIVMQANHNPTKFYIASEVYLNGIMNTIKLIKHHNLKNIKIFHGDARDFLYTIPDDFFSVIWILFPDPWRKKRHHKRRIINNFFLDFIIKKIKPKIGNLIIATDHDEYSRYIKTVCDFSSVKTNGCMFNIQHINQNRELKLFYSTKYYNKSKEINPEGNINTFLIQRK